MQRRVPFAVPPRLLQLIDLLAASDHPPSSVHFRRSPVPFPIVLRHQKQIISSGDNILDYSMDLPCY